MLFLKLSVSAIILVLVANLIIKFLKERKQPIQEEVPEEPQIYSMKDIVDEENEPDDWEPINLNAKEEHECNCGECHCGEEEHVCQCEECHCHKEEELKAEPLEEIVFINKGASASKKYHASPDAHNMDGAEAMFRAKAEEEGFEPCGKCFKK